MRIPVSEFQFAYSITREIEDALVFGNIGIPSIPTQNEESILGYDVAFGLKAYFLQYKIPAYMKRSTANEWKRMGETPYYRIHIYPDRISHQHNNLVALARNPKNHVFYCAPAFHTEKDYIYLHKAREVAKHSAFIDAAGLRSIKGSDQHALAYLASGTPAKATMFSEPRDCHITFGWPDIRYEQGLYASIEEFVDTMMPMLNNQQQFLASFKNHLQNGVHDQLHMIGEYFLLQGIALLLLGKKTDTQPTADRRSDADQ